MKCFKIVITLIFVLVPVLASAQLYNSTTVYRPSGLNWQQIQTEHFRIVFPDGEDLHAYRAAAILESQYNSASDLTGGKLKNFPVILNNYNDLSNGFVSTLNFRSEVELTSFKGKGMNPQSGDWLETVLPHELIHATHFNVQQPFEDKKVSFPNLISLLSPDLARTFHGFPPKGLHEGLAVYHETESVAPMGGRGNYTFFTNQFNSNFGSPARWNMGQTMIPSDYSRPYGRHYISGYSFVNWLHDEFGEDISRNAIRFHYHNFFLGYGYALRKKTGFWPRKLYSLYEEDLEEKERTRLGSIPVNTTEQSQIIDTPYYGEVTHAPKWITNNKLLFYGSFYNGRTGFYQYDLDSKKFKLVLEIFLTGDYNYKIQNERELYFSNYKRNPLLSGIFSSDIQLLDLSTGERNRLTDKARVYAPATNGNRVFGIQAEGPAGKIIEVSEDGGIKVIKEFEKAVPVSLKFNPENPEQLAVVLRKRGVQALWITSVNTISADLDKSPDIAFKEASIHDPEWHPDGSKVLFTLDAYPAMNVYEYDLESGTILQITSSLYNAFEASYSPNGNRIAYVLQVDDEQKMATLERANFFNLEVDQAQMMNEYELDQAFNRPMLGSQLFDSLTTSKKSAYRGDLMWLKPRAVLPVYRENSNTPQYGISITSIDVLSRQAYSAEITGIQDRLWYDITYTNKMFYPGFEVNSYSEPYFFLVTNPNNGEDFGLMRQDRGLSFSIPLEYVFRGDTRFSSISFEPEISAEQFKYYNLSPDELSDFSDRYKAGVYSQLNLGVLRLSRDIQPSSGISFFALYDQTLNEPTSAIRFPGGAPFVRTFSNQWTAYYGVFGFVSPLRRWNQSLRLDLRILQQSENALYSNSLIIPMGFSDIAFPNYDLVSDTGFQNVGRVSTRYTIPLIYPETGGFTLPLYLSSIYLTTFTHTLTDMDANDLVESSRTIIGGGFHVQFKVSNLLFDIGVGLAYEPARKNTQFIFGQF